jgi:hypothetical protein
MLPSGKTRPMRYFKAFVGLLTWICVLAGDPPVAGPAPEMQAVLDGIHASSLRDDLKFIASDELEGRDSPSPGLDRAADYIAAQFRAAGLEPGPDGSYFQNAPMLVQEADYTGFELTLVAGSRRFSAKPSEVVLGRTSEVNLQDAPLFRLDTRPKLGTESELDGKVVIANLGRNAPGIPRGAKPALVILLDPRGESIRQARPRRLEDPAASATERPAPRIRITGEEATRFFSGLKPGSSGATATIHIAAPHRTPATLRNVIGVLRGSDPLLRDTYVLLTAHYDHLGVKPDGPGDRIYNGANDDGSGTVSVMEVARALSKLPEHPRRSIVFMTFFGEEEGLIGSLYYARHPVWPIEKTVADLNLEQVGRTDSTEGRQISNASLTGFDYSDITSFVQQAGKQTGIHIYKNAQGSDAFFALSDNISLAEAGVPAQTLCVAFDYSDYHAVGDEWQKIDYDNMARVDRAIALAMFLMADSEQLVRWNQGNPKTAPFVKAGEKRGLP